MVNSKAFDASFFDSKQISVCTMIGTALVDCGLGSPNCRDTERVSCVSSYDMILFSKNALDIR